MGLETVKQRTALKPRREPYWHPLSTGRHVGYRRTADGGSWIARCYDSGTRKRLYCALPEVSRLPAAEQFSEATRKARDWFEHLDKGGTPETVTVREACQRYVTRLREDKGDGTADDAEARFRRYVDEDEIALVEVHKLAKRHLDDWRKRLRESPKRVQKGAKQVEPKSRSAGTINRDLVALRAALNLAKRDGFVTTDTAWAEALKPAKNADRRRNLYLDRDQRREVIAALPDDAANFVRGLCALPLRPGALASLRVSDFDKRAGTVTIPTDKAGAGRSILLPDATANLLAEVARDKLPGAHLFSRADGSGWNKDAWKGPIKSAAKAAGLPGDTVAYTFRHSVITDLVSGGLDLFTVAALSGTSVAMIEKHYGQLQQDRARDALSGLAL